MTEDAICKIAIVGPESTGKTTLTGQLAAHYGTNWVPEYAREYLDSLKRDYRREDLRKIAEGQLHREDEKLRSANRYLFYDTNLVVLKIWQEHKYGESDPWIDDQLRKRHYDLYLLSACDVPWEYDPQRENPHDRTVLFEKYQHVLEQMNVPYHVLEGGEEQRFNKAIQIISNLSLSL